MNKYLPVGLWAEMIARSALSIADMLIFVLVIHFRSFSMNKNIVFYSFQMKAIYYLYVKYPRHVEQGTAKESHNTSEYSFYKV